MTKSFRGYERKVVVAIIVMVHFCEACFQHVPTAADNHMQQTSAVIQQQQERRLDHMVHLLSHAPSPYLDDSYLLLSAIESNPILEQLEPQFQGEQMRNAMVLKTMQNTQWRLLEDRKPVMSLKHLPRQCRSSVEFRGFADQPNKGKIRYVLESLDCQDSGVNLDLLSSPASSLSYTGNWVSKPSEIRQGSVQLSARWKVKLPSGTFIYKGFLQTSSTRGRGGLVTSEMQGLILTGEELNNEVVVGRFRGDLVRMLPEPQAAYGSEKRGSQPSVILMTPR